MTAARQALRPGDDTGATMALPSTPIVPVPMAPPPPDDPDRMVGRDLAPFRVVATLGRGAMGRVYAAEHVLLRRRVAIKVLEPQFARDPETVARFVEEARAVNSIRHPNIVDITDFGEVDGRPYYVMELLDGETLAARIQRIGKLEPADAVAVGAQVASALAAAHDHGVVHRDLKPDNIFLCNHPDYPDRVKVLDFGVAKLLRRDATDSPAQTEAGRVLGTPFYMSPEQSLGTALDHRTDVYALGVVLFECLTGAVPFDRPTAMQVLMAHINDVPPRMSALGHDVPAMLEDVVQRALAKRPAERFEDMRHLRAVLLGFKERTRRQAQASARAFAAEAARPVTALVPAPPVRALVRAESAAVEHAPSRPVRPASTQTAAELAEVVRRIILTRIESRRLVIPTIATSVQTVLKELSAPNINLARIAKILGEDPLVAAQLLRISGSTLYCTSRRPQNLLQAVVQLGTARLRNVLLELSTRRVFDSPRAGVRAAFNGIWTHSVAVAALARLICKELGNPAEPDVVHLGGLLHDIGKPLVGVMLLEAEKVIGKGFQVDPATWLDIVGLTHRQVAVELARSWDLNGTLSHVVAFSGSYHPDEPTTSIVCLANAVAKKHGRTVGPVDRDQVDDAIAEGADLLKLDWRFVHDLTTRMDAALDLDS
ncbi:MAG: HDOD domain-containing protein [Deltaproteobacteria bacterium]|nr:HDOD domain-containing protein [Deltaproteobacteria bacterium]